MCRLMAFYGIDPILVADVVLWPARSIIKQSYDARERKNDSNLPHHLGYGNLNGDGFGIGWFSTSLSQRPDSANPCVFTSITPAWNNENLNRLATKIESRLVFAHVRAAYPGMPVSEQNCHPFQWGRFLFMHNGVVAGFMQVRRHLLALLSDAAYNAVQSFHSDSAVCFALFLNQLPDMHAAPNPVVMLKALEDTISIIQETQSQHGIAGNSLLNFCVSDGATLVATRYTSSPDEEPASLYYAEGCSYDRSKEGVEESGIASAAAAASDPGGQRDSGTANASSKAVAGEGDYHLTYSELGSRVCLIASEPVTSSGSDWVEVPRNTALVVCRETSGVLCVMRSPLVAGAENPRRAEVYRCLEAVTLAAGVKPGAREPVRAPRVGEGHEAVRASAASLSRWPSEATGLGSGGEAGGPASAPSEDEAGSGAPPAGKRRRDGGRGGPAWEAAAGSQDADEAGPGHISAGVVPEAGVSSHADQDASTQPPPSSASLERHLLTGHSGTVMALCASHDLLFSGATDCSIKVWSLQSLACVATLRGHRDPIRALTVCGTHLASLGAKTLRLWALSSDFTCASVLAVADVTGNAKTVVAPCPAATASAAAWVYVGSQDCRVRGFRAPAGAGAGGCAARPAPTVDGDRAGAAAATSAAAPGTAPSPFLEADSPRCMTSRDRISSHVPPAAGAAAITPEATGHAGAVTALAASGEVLFSASADSTIRVWRLPNLTHERVLRGHRGSVLALHLAGGVLLSGGRDAVIRVWDCGTLVCRRTLPGHCGDVLALTSVGIAVPAGGAGEYADLLSPGLASPLASAADISPANPLFLGAGGVGAGNGIGNAGSTTSNLHRRQPLLYASASADGCVRLWDAATFACLRVLGGGPGASPVMACALTETHAAAALPDGVIRLYACDDLFVAAAGRALGVPVEAGEPGRGGVEARTRRGQGAAPKPEAGDVVTKMERELERALRTFIRLRTISVDPSKSEDCFRGAKFLHRLLEGLGAEVKLVQPMEGKNPLVIARLGRCPTKPTVTFYGHYDVQPALEPEWQTDPFELSSIDGHLYGRGVSDNKGPVLAFIYAVKELLHEHEAELPVNVAFLIEGEEENGSTGFHEAVSAHLGWFEGSQIVIISNTLWVGERVPCLTYGMRGMISASIEVHGPARDLHSGNEGGVFSEPLADLTKVLASLVDARANILVPGFYDAVRPGMLDAAMRRLPASHEFSLEGYRAQIGVRRLTAGRSEWDLLAARWCLPSLSVVDVRVGSGDDPARSAHYRFGPTRFSVIPRAAVGQVAIRFVPAQRPESLVEHLRAHVAHEFAKLRTGNEIAVKVHSIGDWWEADEASPYTKLAERVVQEEWSTTPLLVREGGTMPVARKLEKMLGAPVLMLPMGQSSDNCHLANERIQRVNLLRGKNVVKRLLMEAPRAKAAQ
uniref:Glutamine amidotransferase type-2 domain-containing protein n=1 Tax=Auxenochlorella protothecoides TaxID=3075 RepID=A0A1D2A699_AUXPR